MYTVHSRALWNLLCLRCLLRIFICYQWGLYFFLFALNYFLSDVPDVAIIQKKRQLFITDKVIEETPDEDEDLVGRVPPGQNKIRSLANENSVTYICCKPQKRNRVREEFVTVSGLPNLNVKVYPVRQVILVQKQVPQQQIRMYQMPQLRVRVAQQQPQQVFQQPQQVVFQQPQRQQVAPQVFLLTPSAQQPQQYQGNGSPSATIYQPSAHPFANQGYQPYHPQQQRVVNAYPQQH